MTEKVLRKGRASIYLQYENNGDSMGVDRFRVERIDDRIILKLRIRPVDENEQQDLCNLYSATLNAVQLSDTYALERLADYLRYSGADTAGTRLELECEGRCLRFDVKARLMESGDVWLSVLE